MSLDNATDSAFILPAEFLLGWRREPVGAGSVRRILYFASSLRAKSRDVSVSCRVTNRRGRSQLMPKRMVKLRWTRGSTVGWPRAVMGSGANGSFQAQIFTDSP